MRVRILFWHSGESFGRKSSLNLTVKKTETLFIHSFTRIAKTLSLDHYMILEIISSPLSVNWARLCLDLLRINERAHSLRMRCRGHSLRIKDFNGEHKEIRRRSENQFPFFCPLYILDAGSAHLITKNLGYISNCLNWGSPSASLLAPLLPSHLSHFITIWWGLSPTRQ